MKKLLFIPMLFVYLLGLGQAAAGGGKHTIGEKYGGGIVMYVTTDGLHGLIAETQDQFKSCTWYNAQDYISDPANHSAAGKLFTDWRLPTRRELYVLIVSMQKGVIEWGDGKYWSSTEVNTNSAFCNELNNPASPAETWSFIGKGQSGNVRAIRSF